MVPALPKPVLYCQKGKCESKTDDIHKPVLASKYLSTSTQYPRQVERRGSSESRSIRSTGTMLQCKYPATYLPRYLVEYDEGRMVATSMMIFSFRANEIYARKHLSYHRTEDLTSFST